MSTTNTESTNLLSDLNEYETLILMPPSNPDILFEFSTPALEKYRAECARRNAVQYVPADKYTPVDSTLFDQ